MDDRSGSHGKIELQLIDGTIITNNAHQLQLCIVMFTCVVCFLCVYECCLIVHIVAFVCLSHRSCVFVFILGCAIILQASLHWTLLFVHVMVYVALLLRMPTKRSRKEHIYIFFVIYSLLSFICYWKCFSNNWFTKTQSILYIYILYYAHLHSHYEKYYNNCSQKPERKCSIIV